MVNLSCTGTLACATAPIAPPGYLAVSILLGELVVTMAAGATVTSVKHRRPPRTSPGGEAVPPGEAECENGAWSDDSSLQVISPSMVGLMT
jgi:hypothetical protein